MLAISVLDCIWCFALTGKPLCVCQELKSVILVADMVQVAALVLAGYHITSPLLIPIPVVLGNSLWWCDLDLMDKLM